MSGPATASDQTSDQVETLQVFYDLKWYPVSFDLAYFLMSAEVARADRGLRQMSLVFVPQYDAIRPDVPPDTTDWDLATHIAWRFGHICLPVVSMFPTLIGFRVAPHRAEALAQWTAAKHQFPDRKDPTNLPCASLNTYYRTAFARVHANPEKYQRPRALAELVAAVNESFAEHRRGRRLIVITLRHTRFSSSRNSNIKAWMKFASNLDATRYFPLFVPDTDTAFTADYGEWNSRCVREAAFDLNLRMALYEAAWLNLSASSGAFGFATLNDRCRTLGFNFVVSGASEASSASLEAFGFPIGKDPLYATQFQHWVWEEDEYPVIVREFAKMAEIIETNGSPA
jgi:hypothetical protein